MKKLIIYILIVFNTLIFSENRVITENDGMLVKKYDDKNNLIEVINNKLDYYNDGIEIVEKLSDDRNKYEKITYEYDPDLGNYSEFNLERYNIENYINDNIDKFNDKNIYDIIEEKSDEENLNVNNYLVSIKYRELFVSDSPLNLEKIEYSNGIYELYSKENELIEKKEYKNGLLNGDYYIAGDYNTEEFNTKIENGNGIILEYKRDKYSEKSPEYNIYYIYSKGEIKNGVKVGSWEFYDNDYEGKLIKVGIGSYENGKLLSYKCNENTHDENFSRYNYEFYDNGNIKIQKYNIGNEETEERYSENGIDSSYIVKNISTKEVIKEINRKLSGNLLTMNLLSVDNSEGKRIEQSRKLVFELANAKELSFDKDDIISIEDANVKYYKNDQLVEEINIKDGKVYGKHYYSDIIDGVERNQTIDYGQLANGEYKGIMLDNLKIDKNINISMGIIFDLNDQNTINGKLINGVKDGNWESLNIDKYDLQNIIKSTSTTTYRNGKAVENKTTNKHEVDGFEIVSNMKFNDKDELIYFLTEEKNENKFIFQRKDNVFSYKYLDVTDDKVIKEVKYENSILKNANIFGFNKDNYQEIPSITGKLTIILDNKVTQIINYKDRLFDGEYVVYKNGAEYYKTKFKNGTGYYKDYDEKIKSSNEGNLINGLKDGLWKKIYYFDETKGQIMIEKIYSMGSLQSVKTDYDMRKYENGYLIFDASDFDKEKNEYAKRIFLSDDRKTIYLENKDYEGRKSELSFESNKNITKELERLSNDFMYSDDKIPNMNNLKMIKKVDGIIIYEKNIKDGHLDGDYIVNDYYGKLLYKTNFKNGTGYYKGYEYDKLIEEGNLVNGKKEGEWIKYDGDVEKNKKSSVSVYKDGKLLELREKNIFVESITKYSTNSELSEEEIYKEMRFPNIKKIEKIEDGIIYKDIYEGNKLIKREIFVINRENDKDIKNLSLNNISIDNINMSGKYYLYTNNIKRLEINYGISEIENISDESYDSYDYNKAVLNGEYIIYDTKGKELYKTRFENGNGYYKKYNENDILILEGEYKGNLQEGIWKRYFDGKLVSEFKYDKGISVSEVNYYSNGNVKTKSENYKIDKFYKNGNIYQSTDLNSTLNSNRTVYFDNGDVKISREGDIEKEFYISKNIKKEKYYKDSVLLKEIMYYENNQKRYEINYKLKEEKNTLSDQKKETNENVSQTIESVLDGKYIMYSQDGKVIYETEFVGGTGIAKYYTNEGKEFSVTEYVDGEIKKGYIILPTTNEKIEYNLDLHILSKEFQDKLNEVNKENNRDQEINDEEKKEVEIPENTNFSMIRAYNSANKMILEVKYTEKGFIIDYKNKVINIKNPNIYETQNLIEKFMNGDKIEFFFQMIGAILDKKGLSLNVYYPEKRTDMSLKISREIIENYINLFIDNTDSDILYDQINSKTKINFERYCTNGNLKSKIELFDGSYIDQEEYDVNGKLIYKSNKDEGIIREFYENGKIKLEVDVEELDILNVKLYNKFGDQVGLENYYEIENPIYDLLHEWLK